MLKKSSRVNECPMTGSVKSPLQVPVTFWLELNIIVDTSQWNLGSVHEKLNQYFFKSTIQFSVIKLKTGVSNYSYEWTLPGQFL